MKWRENNTCKMKMVFKCENHDLLLGILYMHLVEGHQKNNTPILSFMGPKYFSLQVMKRIMKWRQKKYVQGANGIQM